MSGRAPVPYVVITMGCVHERPPKFKLLKPEVTVAGVGLCHTLPLLTSSQSGLLCRIFDTAVANELQMLPPEPPNGTSVVVAAQFEFPAVGSANMKWVQVSPALPVQVPPVTGVTTVQPLASRGSASSEV